MKQTKIRTGDLAGWQRKVTNARAWGTIIFVVVVVSGWHLWTLAARPAHLMEMAAETGSLGRFIGNPEVTADGTRVSFSRGTDTGGGLFVYDLASGRQQLIYEDSGDRRQAQFGWSPDGKLLAFSGLKNGKSALMIFNADSGQIETTIPLYSAIKEFMWLSPSSFIFHKGGPMHLELELPKGGLKQVPPPQGEVQQVPLPQSKPKPAGLPKDKSKQVRLPKGESVHLELANGELMRVDKHSDSDWSQPYHFVREEKASGQSGVEESRKYTVKGLMAISPDSVAFMARNSIWELKVHDSTPVILWKGSVTNSIVDCCYSMENETFLLRLRDQDGEYLASYFPARRQFVNFGKIANTNAVNVCWINHGKGYAYLLNESGSHSIFIKADSTNAQPIQCVPQDGVRGFTAGGNCIYANGCLEGQPEGVAEYNVADGSARYVVPSQAQFRFAKNVMPSEGWVTNSLGKVHAYRVWSPANFDGRKKYPLVLVQQMRVWNADAEVIANAGAYYVSVERPDFNDPQIDEWAEDVMAAYQVMSKNPNIDTNNVYLSGASEETVHIVDLLNKEPALWKGAILISPIAFPDLSRTRVAKLLINCGEADEYDTFGKIKEFQENAARSGIPVTVAAFHTGHVFVSALANKESTQQFVQFLFE